MRELEVQNIKQRASTHCACPGQVVLVIISFEDKQEQNNTSEIGLHQALCSFIVLNVHRDRNAINLIVHSTDCIK